MSKTGKVCKFVKVAFDRLEDSFIDTFGVNQSFLDLQRRKIEIELMKCKQIQTGDYSDQIFIDLAQDELDQIVNKNPKGGSKIIKLVPWVEHEMGGMAIDITKTTVFDFYNRVNFIIEKNK